MRERSLTFRELALVAGTRGLLGVGVGLLLAGRLSARQRRSIGLPLLLTGAISTIPIMIYLLRKPALPELASGLEEPAMAI